MGITPNVNYSKLTNAELSWVQDGAAGIVVLAEVSAASGTASGKGVIYIKSGDSKLYYQNDSGTEYDLTATGSGAPTDAQYVVLSANGSLTAERILTGTSNQIIITDGGANNPVTLSLPQGIGTASVVTFANLQGTAYVVAGADIAITDGGTGASSSAAARTALGLAIGSDIQAYDAQLADIAGMSPASSAFVGSNATNLILRSAADTRADLGLVIGTNVQAYGADLTAIEALAATAFAVRSGTNTWVQRSLAGTTNQVNISNADGVAGDPTFSLPQSIATNSSVQFGKLGLGTAVAAGANDILNLAASGNITVSGSNIKRSMILSGAGGWSSTTSGAAGPTKTETTTNKDNYQYLIFGPAATAYAEWTVAMPDNYDASTLTAKYYWTSDNTNASAVVWQIQGAGIGDNESLDVALGTAISVTDTHNAAAYKLNISAETSAITLAGTPVGGELVQFRVKRSAGVGSDTAATAYLVAVKLEYGVNAYSD